MTFRSDIALFLCHSNYLFLNNAITQYQHPSSVLGFSEEEASQFTHLLEAQEAFVSQNEGVHSKRINGLSHQFSYSLQFNPDLLNIIKLYTRLIPLRFGVPIIDDIANCGRFLESYCHYQDSALAELIHYETQLKRSDRLNGATLELCPVPIQVDLNVHRNIRFKEYCVDIHLYRVDAFTMLETRSETMVMLPEKAAFAFIPYEETQKVLSFSEELFHIITILTCGLPLEKALARIQARFNIQNANDLIPVVQSLIDQSVIGASYG